MRLLLFWGAVSLIAYTYLFFPMLVIARGLLRRRPYTSAAIAPRVSVIIAAYNEAKHIAARLENLLALDYPQQMLEIIVASDGSSDATDDIVRSYSGHGVTLLSLPRQGKAAALNAAVDKATGDILVFSDANSMYAPDALRALVRPFADPNVGGVAGNQCYLKEGEGGGANPGERSYWSFDRKLKEFESMAGSTISATGAIYAIRRTLFEPAPAGVTDDFAISTGVIERGFRLVFAPDALAYEPVAGSSTAEFQRKVRVITRGLRAVQLRRRLLDPRRYGFYAVQLFSHKVLRRLVAIPLLVLLFVTPTLWTRGVFYRFAALAQTAFYACAALGFVLGQRNSGGHKVLAVPLYFSMVNYAALLATVNLLRGRRIDRWETQRPADAPTRAPDYVPTQEGN